MANPVDKFDPVIHRDTDRVLEEFNRFNKKPVTDLALDKQTVATGSDVFGGQVYLTRKTSVSSNNGYWLPNGYSKSVYGSVDWLTDDGTISAGTYFILFVLDDSRVDVTFPNFRRSVYNFGWTQGTTLSSISRNCIMYADRNNTFGESYHYGVRVTFYSATRLEYDISMFNNSVKRITLYKIAESGSDNDLADYVLNDRVSSKYKGAMQTYQTDLVDRPSNTSHASGSDYDDAAYYSEIDTDPNNNVTNILEWEGREYSTQIRAFPFRDDDFGRMLQLYTRIEEGAYYSRSLTSGSYLSTHRGHDGMDTSSEDQTIRTTLKWGKNSVESFNTRSETFNYVRRFEDYKSYEDVTNPQNTYTLTHLSYRPKYKSNASPLFEDDSFFTVRFATVGSKTLYIDFEGDYQTEYASAINYNQNFKWAASDFNGRIPKAAFLTVHPNSDGSSPQKLIVKCGTETTSKSPIEFPIGNTVSSTHFVIFDNNSDGNTLVRKPCIYIESEDDNIYNITVELNVVEWDV